MNQAIFSKHPVINKGRVKLELFPVMLINRINKNIELEWQNRSNQYGTPFQNDEVIEHDAGAL